MSLLTRPKDSGDPLLIRRGDLAAALLFAAILLVTLCTFRDYGYGWDEAWQNRWYGQAVLRFFSTLGRDLSAVSENNFYLYGGTFDVFAELLALVSPLDPRNARHLANLSAGLLCLAGTWRTARHVGGPAAGFWAPLFLVCCAPFYGHMFINAKDIPFAAGYIWSIYWLLRVSSRFPRPPLADRLWLGFCLGLALGVRIGGVLILLYFALLTLADLIAERRRSRKITTILTRAGTIIRTSLPAFAVAYLLMLAFWPAALLHPLDIPLEAFKAANHFKGSQAILWAGRNIYSGNLPWDYLPTLFGVELPEILVILFPLALFFTLFSVRHPGEASPPLLLLLLATLLPPIWAIVHRAVIYDNMRHFLFILPPLCCLAGNACAQICASSERPYNLARKLSGVVLAIALTYSTLQMATLHPYEYTYKNLYAGGLPKAENNFETDYWLTSYREAAELVNTHARRVALKAGIPFAEARFIVGAVGNEMVLQGVLPEQFSVELVDGSHQPAEYPDYLIATTRWGGDQFYPDYPVIGVVGRRGMTFAVIKTSPDIGAFDSLQR